ncbi:peptidoglycan D,D-transpeptidase FtsI family protein [Glaciecola petra]|uniref:Peptidoglycan D,D-transpeptidase FtsI n=1 Tax=Glaciecola petra TaxID=3075602 RepID=A0ABU2ZLI3_9ALTE|nr:penicillin-binding transpeptidase domain-containing protein [Aestuariibacter sp. P117]MDT0593493.1 penicillin-binding transpeptidase domain-containing protein [Aestuariibacter sp. P117]
MTVKATLQKPRKKPRSNGAKAAAKVTNKGQAKRKVAPSLVQWRFAVVLLGIVFVFFALASRAAYIQVIQPDDLIEHGDNRTIRVRDIPSYRGLITDRFGQQLAVSVPAKAIYADPKIIHDNKGLADVRRWQALAEVLGTDVDKLINRLDNPKRRFIYLQRQVTPAVAKFVKKLDLPGVYLRDEAKRYYPAGEVSAHIIGFTDVDDKGIEGIERLYNKWLTGTPDIRKIRRDAKNRQVEIMEQEEGKKAEDIQLTIDQRIQAVAYREIKEATVLYQAASASIVVVDVHTGEILALANTPSYNPNNRSTVSSHRVRNRAITDTFEPGSVLKPLAVIAALENGEYQRDTIIDTNPGWRRLGGSRIEDGKNHGEITLTEVIKHSSNVGTSELALSMPKEVLIDFYYNMGLMSDSGTNMVGESSGLFHERPRWSEHEISSLSFGYNISTTAAQLARVYATIANGGIKRPLTIVQGMQATEQDERVISEHSAREILLMMETVTQTDGTARKAAVPGYRVAGKTGTSKKAFAGSYGNDYVNIFAGIAPVSNPQIAIVVLINDPAGDIYYAGDTAAPVFSKVVAKTMQMLNIPPDASNVDVIVERQANVAQ